MRTGIILGCMFFLFLFIEQSFFHALTGILASIPLMLIAGMILMQRVGIEEGIAWCVALALFRMDITALVLAAIGPVLILQIFTTRSMYALVGFGLASYIVAAGTVLLLGEFFLRVFGVYILPLHPYLHALTELILLVPGLFLGVLVVRSIERSLFAKIAFKRSP